MEENASNSTTLIFKNIPKQIDEIKSLLDSLCISPKEVKSFGRKRALLSYERRIDAEHALEIIRKLEFSGRTANISLFCKEKLKENKTENIKTNNRRSHKGVQTTNEAPQANLLTSQQISKYVRKLYATEGDLCFDQPPPPYLKYNYPPINKDILDNISISLLSNKRFYTQVLHLMNRMNLEPPFNTRSYKFTPPGVPKESSTQTDEVMIKEMVPSQTKGNQEREEIETEMESSEEDELKTRNRTKLLVKRKLSPQPEQFKKKAKQILQTVQKLNKETPKKRKAVNFSLKDIFETSGNNATTTAKIGLQLARPQKLVDTRQAPETALNLPIDLKTQKITLLELESLPIYKNYQKGQPSNKLYIKNLHKDVTVEDIGLIYERYIKDNGLKLDIKVMQHGRMKGQAFVTFHGDQMEIIPPIISQALDETNGFILRDKPMVVCYGKQQNLGLIDTIYIDGAQPSNNTSIKSKSKLSQQSYEYVIAVDFEATCWEDQAPPQWRESEIIEFPAVLINLKTGKIEAEFHKYIMPIESPKLSAFCTKLTGITQKTVDNGIPLQTALMMFQEWLRKELRARHLMLPKVSKDNKIGNCAFVTWTDWDFGICLEKECNRKRIKKPPYFNQWIDIRVTYRNWYKYKPLNFLDALTHVGLLFEGKQHSGIDDAKNLAALTHKLVNDGATLTLTKDLTPFQLNLNCVF